MTTRLAVITAGASLTLVALAIRTLRHALNELGAPA